MTDRTLDRPLHPDPHIPGSYGMSGREHAAISLKLPLTQDTEVNAAVARARLMDMAAQIASGYAMHAVGAQLSPANIARKAVSTAKEIIHLVDNPTT